MIRLHQPDLVLMQEATAAIDSLPREIGGYCARNSLPGRTHGLAAWSAQPLCRAPQVVALAPGIFVRRICQILVLREISIANVHLSHGQILNRRQLRSIARVLPGRAAILGDCNMVGPAFLPGFSDVGPRGATHAAGRIVPLRLDRCLIRGLSCDSVEALGQGDSDHRPIVIHLRLNDPSPSLG
jgi:endonuclease/exonuclease/phosphatase family metal-dependent hydrolase